MALLQSRTTGEVPLGVIFEVDQSANHIVWQIDNQIFYGKLAAYVFHEPKAYTVKATITDTSGTTALTTTITATRDTNRTKTHVSTSGNDTTGDGSEANPYATPQRGIQASSAGNEVLLKRGDIFDTTSIISINKANMTVSAYGAGNDPVIRTNATVGFTIADDGITLMNMIVEGSIGQHGVNFITDIENHLIHNCEIHTASIGIHLAERVAIDPLPARNIIVSQCNLHDNLRSGGNGYGVFGQADGFALLDSIIRDQPTNLHGARIAGGSKVVVNKCYFTSRNDQFTSLTIRGGTSGTTFAKATISECWFENVTKFLPQEVTFDEDISEIELINNVFNIPEFSTFRGIEITGTDIKIIGNAFIHTAQCILLKSHSVKRNDTILISGNRSVSDTILTRGHFFVDGSGDNVTVRDNFHESYSNNGGSSRAVKLNGTNLVFENNEHYSPNQAGSWTPFQVNGVHTATLSGWTKRTVGDFKKGARFAFDLGNRWLNSTQGTAYTMQRFAFN